MASKIRVTTQELRNKANELESLNTAFRSDVMGLRDDEMQLAQSYEGDAQKQFHIQFTNDMEKFDRFYQTIQQFIQQLRADADNYDKTEAMNVSIAATRK